jgi:hypothetical protein
MLGEAMLKTRRRRLDRLNETAVQRLAQIEASIAALPDEDLLDLADIFKAKPHTPLGEIASAEMARRSISL